MYPCAKLFWLHISCESHCGEYTVQYNRLLNSNQKTQKW